MAADDDAYPGQPPPGQPTWRPIPDPTILTTEALTREIAHLREYMDGKVHHLETRIRGVTEHIDHAIDLHARLDAEKFAAIEQRFTDRELLVSASFDAGKEAVAQALAASKEAVAKSELNFTKSLDNLSALIAEGNKAADAQVAAVKDRVALVEGERGGMSQALALGISLAFLLVGVAGVVITVILSNAN